MSHVLARTGLRATARTMQRRNMAGGGFTDKMHVQKNKFVEEWNGRREITEQAFEINPGNLFQIIMMVMVIPYGIYDATRRELFKKGDRRHLKNGLV